MEKSGSNRRGGVVRRLHDPIQYMTASPNSLAARNNGRSRVQSLAGDNRVEPISRTSVQPRPFPQSCLSSISRSASAGDTSAAGAVQTRAKAILDDWAEFRRPTHLGRPGASPLPRIAAKRRGLDPSGASDRSTQKHQPIRSSLISFGLPSSPACFG
jgi:hypothetical protein